MCFENLIGINTECTPSTSGLNLTDIGITLDELNDIVGREYEDGQELAAARLEFASKLISNQVLSRFGDRFKTNTLVDSKRLGIANDNKRIIAGTVNYTGIEIELCNTSSFLDLNINSIDLAVETTATIEIKVFDLIQGREIDSISIDAIAGEVVNLPLLKQYGSERKNRHLFFGYDSSVIDAPEYSITQGGCSSCAKGGSQINRWMKVRGGTLGLAAQPIKSNIGGSAFTGGISINYSITCNHSLWICTMKNLIALPVLYKLGSLIAEYALQTNRENPEVFDVEKWESRLESFEFNYRENLDNIIDKIKLPSDESCFSCNKSVSYVMNMP